MKFVQYILLICLVPLLLDANNDRAIYRKKYSNENKVALIIGNNQYTHFSTLKNALNDAEDMKNTLEKIGFKVIFLSNGDLQSMEENVRKFSSMLREGGVGFFYYAGHGLQVDNTNYLIPVGKDIKTEVEVKYKALSVDFVIDSMEHSRNRLNVVVLDACRNDPFSRGGGGLAQINNAKGMYIAFATSPGNVASDGSGKNGLFTKHLLENIQKENLTLDAVFKNTRTSVYNESDGRQLPWTSSSVIGDFYFNINENGTTVNTRPQHTATIVREDNTKEKEERYTTSIRNEVMNANDQNGLYVCYDSKTVLGSGTTIYSGCTRSVFDCLQNEKLRFGKYPSNDAAKAALSRCHENRPRVVGTNNQSTNKSGLYVCYENKIMSGSNAIYIGCSREENTCKSNGKYHFGKYPNDLKAHQAYGRCSKSNPKFVDSQGM